MSQTFSTTIVNKITHLQEIVRQVIRSNQLYKTLGIVEANDLNSCVVFAETIFKKLKKALNNDETKTENEIINTLQDIVFEISTLISLYGCDRLDNLIEICIGNKFVSLIEGGKYKEKYNLLNTYVHPTHYKIMDWKKTSVSKSNDDYISKNADNLDCFNIDTANQTFQTTIYGIKIAIHNMAKKHTIIVYGFIDDMDLNLIDNKEINNKIEDLLTNPPEFTEYKKETYERFIKCLTLKDILVFSDTDLKERYIGFVQNNILKKPLLRVINEFNEKDLIYKRNILIMLLIHSDKNECHYLAYLLYDLLSNDVQGIIDTYEQVNIYNSLPYYVKKYFREAMKDIINYTNKLTKVDINKLSLEQRICLMKTDDLVKEKAMVKLKEVKMKSEDTGSKAIHYLEGLLKIPFGIYKEEPILRVMQEIISDFSKLVSILPFNKKQKYSGIELRKYMPLLKTDVRNEFVFSQFKILVAELPKNKLIEIHKEVKSLITKQIKYKKISSIGKSLPELRTQLIDVVEDLMKINMDITKDCIVPFINQKNIALIKVDKHIHTIDKGLKNIKDYMSTVTDVLNNSVYGHTKAKRQIERIIGQWINGDSTGYCFGFEGPPGVGKTSLAKKGISYCLKDEEGNMRPFSFIAMGGSTNSSTLDGHNYTYVGSTWGRIADILMDTKIMNPIIFIDELDKVSKTENGKEIIGILTHLVDQTQNDSFQDKYFNGINLNLSRALFIFSYNDAELIDRILLDRIHRIKFDHLSLEDKMIITRQFILPEIYKKMGLDDMIEISDAVIEFIINAYTSEPGVRKLKELMFEIVGEINLAVLKNDDVDFDIPIVITTDDIKNKYLKERTEVKIKKIHETSAIGVINGLWANSMGKGGVLPIEASFYPSSSFLDLKLTGMQGNVMKESMEVAKSLAWSIFAKDVEHSIKIKQKLEENKCQGLHIHVPEGATPKDGPSAGTAITMVMYSLFSGRKIKHDIAITGEICLQGRVTAIGGLDLKILGGICAGVKMFIYPQENEQDFLKFMEKYGANDLIKGIKFVSVETYEEVIPLIFE